MPKPPGSGVSKQAIEEVAVVGNVNVEDLLVGGEDGPLNSPQGKVVDDDGSGCKGGGRTVGHSSLDSGEEGIAFEPGDVDSKVVDLYRRMVTIILSECAWRRNQLPMHTRNRRS